MSAGRQYRLLRELGTGTFGTVYQAEMASAGGFKKQVALKVLHPMWETDKDAARRFRDEARMLGHLRHRHIVQVDGLVKVGGRWAVVMEFVPGADGNVVLKACRKANEAFPVPAALEVVSAVASALDAAYNAKVEGEAEPLHVVHRDIKPSNIRLTEDGDVKVLDFGIARAEFSGREAITHSVRYGSVRYMAPERHKNKPDTPAGDLFALGCVLYELLTGKPLGNVEAEWAQHHEKVHAKIAKLTEGLGEQGAAIVDLITAMLQFEPEKRPTAAEVAEKARLLSRSYPGEDLASFARRFIPEVARLVPDTSMPIERVVSEGVGSSEEVVMSRSSLPPVLVESDEDTRQMRRNRLPLFAGLGVAGVALLVSGLFVMFGTGSAGQDASAKTTIAPSTAMVTHPPPLLPLPAPAPAPEPVPVAAPETTTTAPPPASQTRSAGTSDHRRESSGTHPPAPEPAPPPPTAYVPVAPAGPLLRAVKFSELNATAMTVTCVGGSATGTTSALVRDLHPGPCTLVVDRDGTQYTTRVEITVEQGFDCDVTEGRLTCH